MIEFIEKISEKFKDVKEDPLEVLLKMIMGLTIDSSVYIDSIIPKSDM